MANEEIKKLRDFLLDYDVFNVQLIIGGHILSISTDVKGSYFILKRFLDEEFILLSYNEKRNYLLLKLPL